MSSLLAGCSNCEFTRRFSVELAGRFYRCPRCREGVLAVPKDGADPSESRETLQFSSTSFEFPLEVERRRREQQQDKETEENTALDATALGQGEDHKRTALQKVSMTSVDEKRNNALAAASEGEVVESLDLNEGKVLKGSQDASARPDEQRGQVGEARRILVECGVCGFHVRIPVEFFGKTVHCPECAGNTVFTESTLEPVKDELLDRLALETTERDAIFRGRKSLWRDLRNLLQGNAIRSFLVGVGLGLLVLLLMWGFVQMRRSSRRAESVERAVKAGWRYASNANSKRFHQPWCPELDPNHPGERITEADLKRGKLELHPCD